MPNDLHRNQVKDLLRRAVTAPTPRDEQSSVGPSELGDPCDFCLGVALTRKYPEFRPAGVREPGGFSLKAWTGTAVHGQLETNLRKLEHEQPDRQPVESDFGLLLEPTVHIWDLEGYGPISGHVDLVYRQVDYAAVVDHKTVDKDKLRQMQLSKTVPDKHVFQINTYGYGLEQDGICPDDVGIHFIPRDSNSAEDIWTVFDRYRRNVAEMALERLETVWHTVRNGDFAKLSKHEDCFPCNRWY